MHKLKAEAIARARAQIARRIARFCQNFSPEELDVLLDRMAGIQCKYEFLEKLPPAMRRELPPSEASPD